MTACGFWFSDQIHHARDSHALRYSHRTSSTALMKFFTDDELRSSLDPDAVIDAIRGAFTRGFADVQMPLRSRLDTGDGAVLIMPCGIAGDPICGVKIVSVSKSNRAAGRVQASYVLLDSGSGETLAVLDANHLTDLRTAATSAVATDLLARKDANVLGIFGTGRQAEAHICVLPRVRNFQKVLLVGTSGAKAEAFAQRIAGSYKADIYATDAANCVASSHVICTCTSSEEPLFPGEWLRPGTHVNLIGTYQPHAREIDSAAIKAARLFVDSYPAALEEAGDIVVPLRSGEIAREHICADLHELTAGIKPGRLHPSDITMFKSVGIALEDLVTAKLLLPLAHRSERT